jgi:hypothetical protein
VEGYLGESKLDLSKTEYKHYNSQMWALLWIQMYGGIDGAHHKTWVLDQVVRILKGTEVIVTLAKWENGHQEERFSLGEPPKEYWEFVQDTKDGEDGPDTYEYDFGIAP